MGGDPEARTRRAADNLVRRFRWAVAQFSDDQRNELRAMLLREGASRELVDTDLGLAWLRATVGGWREILDTQLEAHLDDFR